MAQDDGMHTSLSEKEQRVLVLLADKAVDRVGIDKTVPEVPREVLQALVGKRLVNSRSADDDSLVTLTRAGRAEVSRLRDAGVLPWPIGANDTKRLMDGTLIVVVIRDPGDDCWRIKECEKTFLPNSGTIKVPPSVWDRKFPSKELAFQYFEDQVVEVNRRG